MHLNDLPRILLRLWWLVVAITVVVAGAALWIASASTSYSARTDVTIVGTNVADDLSAERVAVFVRGELPVYQSLMRTPQVLERAVELSGQSVTPEELGRTLVVNVVEQVVSLRVETGSPERSQALVTGAATALVEAIDQLHRESNAPVVRAMVLDQLPTAASTTSSSRTLLLGLALGLVLGCAAAALVSLARGRAGSAAELAHVIDDRILGDFPGTIGAPEAGRWLRTVVEGRSGQAPRLVVVAGAARDEASREIALALADAYAEDGAEVRLVVDGADIVPPAGVLAERVAGISRDTLEGLTPRTADAVTVVAARSVLGSADALRAAVKADRVLLAVHRDDRAREAVAASETLQAGGAELRGVVVVDG
ncbi:MAG: hypothetical protein IPJ61_03365 [Tessaracoccus sp.]|uniref:hypothetical protein n=1 Tax=Tessaracoccus sp. TaxID=1971211 RepID=UPI001EB66C25|nr:hypothetical protein [Tessaracoccus sp.]MBK7820123.1 hypothetical protein [Tessaracoccus sp.]